MRMIGSREHKLTDIQFHFIESVLEVGEFFIVDFGSFT